MADSTQPPRRRRKAVSHEAIVDTAVALATVVGWERLRLREVADRLGVSLAEVRAHFADADAIADAWFARALDATLRLQEPGFADLPAKERVYLVTMRWFDACAEHRQVAVDMISTKLYPSHPHHWVPLIFNLSRLIQWIREAALLDAPGRQRQIEEVGLTLTFLATLRVWASDPTEGQDRTRRFLRRTLDRADGLMARYLSARSRTVERS